MLEIRGTDKYAQRIAKAREVAAFKKKMTERSGFSATGGMKKARKQAKNQPETETPQDSFRGASSPQKYKSAFGGTDGSQIVPPKQKIPFVKERPPLHHPKGEPAKKVSSPKN